MSKKEAQGYLALWSLMAVNHLKDCVCGKTVGGAATTHGGKTAEEFAAITAAAEG